MEWTTLRIIWGSRGSHTQAVGSKKDVIPLSSPEKFENTIVKNINQKHKKMICDDKKSEVLKLSKLWNF